MRWRTPPYARLGRQVRSSRKRFSHCRSKFPTNRAGCRTGTQERARELKTQKMVSVGMINADSTSAKRTGGAREPGRCCKGRARDLEQNLCCFGQRAAYCYQGSSRTDVQRGRKFKKFLTLLISAANEHWYRQWQSNPPPTLSLRPSSNQRAPLVNRELHGSVRT